jgi:hypothetical protein
MEEKNANKLKAKIAEAAKNVVLQDSTEIDDVIDADVDSNDTLRAILQSIWLVLVYVSASLICGAIITQMTIIKNPGDASFAHGHIEWALGIFIGVLYVTTKPLFYSWRSLSKSKIIPFLVTTFAWPMYLLFIATMLMLLPVDWSRIVLIWHHLYFWLWIFVASDPFNVLGKWINDSSFWQSHIETWRSFGTLDWLYSQYPPKSAGDVAVGLISMTVVTLIAPLFYWFRG